MCGLAGVCYMDLDNFDYNFRGKRVVLLCVAHIFLILLVFYSKFESLLTTLN